MPTYEFACRHCGNAFEDFLPISSETSRACPICGRDARRKISSGIGLIFKGSGFYVNDYKKPGETGKVESE